MSYRLHYTLPDGEEVSAEVLPIESIPCNDRYFYALRNGEPFCFIKLRNPDEYYGERQEAEKLLDAVNSSYVTSFADGLMDELFLFCPENEQKVPATDFLLLEYLPYNLEQFRERMRGKIDAQQQERYRGQILLKLLEGAGHLHRRGTYNRDIKPQNIMIRAPHPATGRIDVRITDMDAAHNAHSQNAPRAGTPPFTPQFALRTAGLQASIWRDLCAICMVAFWMYGASEDSLYKLGSLPPAQCDFKERARNILSGSGATFPDDLLDILLHSLEEAFFGFSFLSSPSLVAQEEQERELNSLRKLRDKLQDYYGESLPELISPSKPSRRWYALLKIDEDYRPVFGMDREYRALSIIGRLGDSLVPFSVGEGRSDACSASFYMGNELPPNNDPPEIYVSCVCTVGNRPFIQAEIYGNSGRLATSGQLLGKMNRVFYSHRDGNIAPDLLKEVRACAAGFYDADSHNIPCRLPAREVVRRADSPDKPNMNIVFLMEKPSLNELKKNDRTAALGGRLIEQIMRRIQESLTPLDCRYYGARSMDRGGVKSFCGGRLNPAPSDVQFEYYTQNESDAHDRSWSDSNRGDRFDFCPELPTVVFGFMRTPVDSWRKIRDFLDRLPFGAGRTGFPCAVDYLQLFFLRQDGFMEQVEAWLPCLDAMVSAEGNCLVTPLEDTETPDPNARWLPIIRGLLR